MNAYGAGWGAGYLTDPNSYVSTDPSYDPYGNNFANSYVSTDPNSDPYGGSSGSLMSSAGLWSAVLGGIGGYAQSQAEADAAKENAKLSAQAKLEIAKQKRQYELDDRAYNQGAVSKWDRYFAK